MKTPHYITAIARAGFEASADKRGRQWSDLDANEREFWHLAAPFDAPKMVRQARLTGYDIRPWHELSTIEQARWRHIAHAMRAMRESLYAAASPIAA